MCVIETKLCHCQIYELSKLSYSLNFAYLLWPIYINLLLTNHFDFDFCEDTNNQL